MQAREVRGLNVSVDVIKSIGYAQDEMIQDILQLHVPQGFIDCDCTYSKGMFYKSGLVKEPIYKFDLYPQDASVVQADSRNLPLEDDSISCMMFDPPFLATKGKSLTEDSANNAINKRFGVYPSEIELHQFYKDTLIEAKRVLKPKGILIFKCQDKVSNSKQYMTHVFVHNIAVEVGFYPKDLFILLAKARIVADWQARNQKNARKYHSYFWVFQNISKQIQYV